MKCLEKDRTRRYETANGLAVDIQRHLNNEPVTARPPSMVYRLQKTVRRNQLAFTAAATGFPLNDSFRHDDEVYYAEFTPDCAKVVTTSADHTARFWEVQPATSEIPDWLASLAEAVAGQRTDDRGFNHPVGVAELIRLRRQLGGSGSEVGKEELAQWFFCSLGLQSRRV